MKRTKKIFLIGIGLVGLSLGFGVCLMSKNSKLRGRIEELEKINSDINLKADRAERYIGKLLVETRVKQTNK